MPDPTPALTSAEAEKLATRLEAHGDAPMYATRFRGKTLAEEAAAALLTLAADRDAALLRGIALGIEAAKAACNTQEALFLRPEYATGQPLSSFYERFACRSCHDAIDAIDIATLAKEASE